MLPGRAPGARPPAATRARPLAEITDYRGPAARGRAYRGRPRTRVRAGPGPPSTPPPADPRSARSGHPGPSNGHDHLPWCTGTPGPVSTGRVCRPGWPGARARPSRCEGGGHPGGSAGGSRRQGTGCPGNGPGCPGRKAGGSRGMGRGAPRKWPGVSRAYAIAGAERRRAGGPVDGQ